MVLSARCGPTSHDALWRACYPRSVKANEAIESVEGRSGDGEIAMRLREALSPRPGPARDRRPH
jgi:hypothetical protein